NTSTGIQETQDYRLYQIGAIEDVAALTRSKAAAPRNSSTFRLSPKQIAFVPVRRTEARKRQLSAAMSSFGLFNLARFNAPASSLDDLSCYPNPFDPSRQSINIQYYLVQDTDIEIAVYDLTGSLVKTWKIPARGVGAQAGLNQVTWDGRNGNNETVANGGYVVSAHAADRKKRFKVLVIK
ncbi:MAG: FlgD immunoglobulin-like domain containing protein, partial [Endomicrobiales bacterium]